MTRIVIYSAALVAFVAATAMTLTSILNPYWVSFSLTAPAGVTITRSLGLHQSCSSVADPPCRPFPQAAECAGDERYFCSMWRSTGFLMSFATVAELAGLVGFLVVMAGGRAKRERGWPIMAVVMLAVAAVQFGAMAIVAYLFDNDEQFLVPGWRLDSSWILCTVSAGIAVLCALSLAISAFVLPPENCYQLLQDPTTA